MMKNDKVFSIIYRVRLLNSASIIPLTADILKEAATYEAPYDLQPQDSIVYASVITHLRENHLQIACFLNRNSKDFDSPNIVDELSGFNCRMIARFDQGLAFIQAQIAS